MEAGRSPNVKIITNAEVQEVSGTAGNFRVKVRRQPRYVDETKCTACGVCAQYCPVTIPDPHNQNLSQRKAIDILYTQAVPSAYAVNPDYCLFLNKRECKQCTRACQAGAIDFNQRSEVSTYQVGSIILATGFKQVNPAKLKTYRYQDSPNVVTGLEFERISSASGPYVGRILRPSDLQKPPKIAFIQCAGSRDNASGKSYCSSVCCKYAVKDAIVALEHEPDLDITIFFMDMRMYGKGLEAFYERAKECGIKFVRSRISGIKRDPETEDLAIKYVIEDGTLRQDTFNLVVLPMGLEAPDGNFSLAKATGIGLNSYGFCKTGLFSPLFTQRDGIYVAGGFRGPMALPDSVMQASGTAACAAELLTAVRRTCIAEKAFPEERPVDQEGLRIGVFVCHCGKNIGGVVDVGEVKKYAATLPDVIFSKDNLYSCSQDTQALIKETIDKEKLNRVVIAACTPRTHEPLFQETIREAGLNRCLLEMVNIRDQCSWVHAHEKEAATEKAKDLIRMAVAKARLIKPLSEPVTDVIPKGLIIGGGLAGMTAALSLAGQGFECYLVEKTARLGGNLHNIHYTLEGEDPQRYLEEIIRKVENHKLIHVLLEAEVETVKGFVGNFETVVAIHDGQGARKENLRHGIIILATGATAYRPDEYLYGRSERVVLQHELEESLASGQFIPAKEDTVVMIQCVGSRDEKHPYCSSICCSMAIKNAIKIKEISPETNVYILYRDMRTYGFHEDYYKQAREQGVVFVRYEKDDKPVVAEVDGRLRVTVTDPLIRKKIVIEGSLLVLSTAIVPREDRVLEKAVSVPRSADGFFLESHVQLKPVDSYVDGIYICGMAQFPKPVDEAVAQAKAAASRAAIMLARGYVKAEPIVSSCDQEKCIGCGMCEYFCPYGAIRMTKVGKVKKAETIIAACKGCGICASYCPARAISMGRFTHGQISAQIAAFGADGS
ncbi:MAG TPA: CoB--CoM heterodisulfide reductase iron-sulfur subunit A family protein [Proteobacteria bacterium]|nr:CoB--CoM heterodisulfide reductase iron-sulfur subunit A family protein [Pseudomonadota bacterium]